jgi:hypothetical protein
MGLGDAMPVSTPRERPLIFSGPSVIQIQKGLKTQTRRTKGLERINENPNDWSFCCRQDGIFHFINESDQHVSLRLLCPYGVPGDRLWVREMFREFDDGDVFYRTHFGNSIPVHADDDPAVRKWQSSMFMPRKFSRLILEITDVRVQRVQEISEEDAKAEGMIGSPLNGKVWYRDNFAGFWDSINAKRYPKTSHNPKKLTATLKDERKRGIYSWHSNPWMWAISFRRIAEALYVS